MKKLTVGIIFFCLFIFFSPTQAQASVIDDIVNGIKGFFVGNSTPSSMLVLSSSIELVKDGDVNNNGQIDAGDIIRFRYIITNTTNQEFASATLKTNINRKEINFIHNVTGTTSLSDTGKTIEIPNLRIAPNQVGTISFDARVNYFTSDDPVISTQADFLGKDKKSYVKSNKKEIKANRIAKDKIPGMFKHQVKNSN